jgi:cyanate permease
MGPVIAGHIFDTTGSYTVAFWTCTAVAAFALLLISSLRQTRPNVKEIPGESV